MSKRKKPSVNKPLKADGQKRTEAELADDELERVAGGAAVDYFITLDAIRGESTDAKHEGTIDIESWSWGTTTSSYSDITLKKGTF
jgi:hypothetical protein